MTALYVLALLLLAVMLGLSLAHALELPGKMRLDEPAYRAVQTIYYPGFTIGGLVGEVGALLLLPVLLVLTPTASTRFWWTAGAWGLCVLCHATYWLVTHPVNGAWLDDTELSAPATRFFGFASGADADWTQLRNVWEYSHVARSCFAGLSFVSMTLAVLA